MKWMEQEHKYHLFLNDAFVHLWQYVKTFSYSGRNTFWSVKKLGSWTSSSMYVQWQGGSR
jgi:hypothetical protein